ncbi:MAG: hypothetical protein ACR2MP_06860 [Streptosporangiaceae bacterium]
MDGGESGIWLAARDETGEQESATLAGFDDPGRAMEAFAVGAEQVADRVERKRLTDYPDIFAAHLRYRAALARADSARAVLGDTLRRNETEIRDRRDVSSVAFGVGVSREYLHRVLNRAEWIWKRGNQEVEPTARKGDPVTVREAVAQENGWTVVIRFAIAVASEHEARTILADVLSHMDMTSDGQPVAERRGDGLWTMEAKLNLSEVPVFDPDDARTRLSYVARNLEGVTWRVVRADEDDALFEWPPSYWATSGRNEVLAHPAIRAVSILASLHAT